MDGQKILEELTALQGIMSEEQKEKLWVVEDLLSNDPFFEFNQRLDGHVDEGEIDDVLDDIIAYLKSVHDYFNAKDMELETHIGPHDPDINMGEDEVSAVSEILEELGYHGTTPSMNLLITKVWTRSRDFFTKEQL